MTTRLLSILILIAVAPDIATAEDRPPTSEQLAAAKVAFEEGNALYKAGQLVEAVEKLEESYRLSRNAFLLYNIGHIYDQLGKTDQVLSYFKRFLAEAPADAKMRPAVQKRMQELERERKAGTANKPEDEGAAAAAGQLTHTQIFSAPPSVALDITAVVSAAAGNATLFYRGTGDAKFTPTPMTKRDDAVVAQIPAEVMVDNWVQYYIELRGPDGKLITRSGKSTSPHLVKIEDRAPTPKDNKVVAEDDPITELELRIARNKPRPKPFAVAKWMTTGVAVSFFGVAFASYRIARNQHLGLVQDTQTCGTPPCREFDAAFAQGVEDRGTRYSTIYKVTLGVGMATAALAGYFWYRNLTAKRPAPNATAWILAPELDGDYAGVAAGARF